MLAPDAGHARQHHESGWYAGTALSLQCQYKDVEELPWRQAQRLLGHVLSRCLPKVLDYGGFHRKGEAQVDTQPPEAAHTASGNRGSFGGLLLQEEPEVGW